MWITLLVLGGVAALVLAGRKMTRSGYASAPFRVVRASGHFSVRDYPALPVVETPSTRSDDQSDEGFSRLFRFITGANESQQKIAMTTPVFMTGPKTNATMAFVLPSSITAETAPRPSDKAVTVREWPAKRFAVLRFSGGRNPAHDAEALARLRAWMCTEGLTEVSQPIYGYFDPPWTPGFLLRNEVMLATDQKK